MQKPALVVPQRLSEQQSIRRVVHRGLPTEGRWIWVGVVVQVFAIALYNVLTWLCHAYLQREISRYETSLQTMESPWAL